MSFTVYPAIDVREGRVVRLRQGDYADETRYGDDPLAFAQRYADGGATWLHLVDLDAAKAGGYTLQPLLRDIVAGTGLRVQTGGGVRTRDDVASLLDAGASRVVVGSLAVRDPASVLAWIGEFGSERLTVALDTPRDADGNLKLPVDGWTETSSETPAQLPPRFPAGRPRGPGPGGGRVAGRCSARHRPRRRTGTAPAPATGRARGWAGTGRGHLARGLRRRRPRRDRAGARRPRRG